MSESGRYVFASQPKAVGGARNRKKYYDGPPNLIKTNPNIMFDRRVVRGPTTTKPLPKSSAGMPPQSRQNRRHDKMLRTGGGAKTGSTSIGKLPTAAQIHASLKFERNRVDVPLHLYLEEHAKRAAFTNESAQTDTFLDEPRPEPYIPMKTGLDAGTQVDTSMVFVYDRDVNPILDVLCGKTVEQALMEVRQEEQFRALRGKQQGLLENLRVEQDQVRMLEQKEKKVFEANQARLNEARQKKEEESEIQKKYVASECAVTLLDGLEDTVFNQLTETKEFQHPISRQINEDFLPWVFNNSRERLKQHEASEKTLRALLKRVTKRKKYVLFSMIDADNSGKKYKVGPIRLSPDTTIRELITWAQKNIKDGDMVTFYDRRSGDAFSPETNVFSIGTQFIGMKFRKKSKSK